MASAEADDGDLLAYARLQRLASANKLVVPGHDPRVMTEFPAVSLDLTDVAVRIADRHVGRTSGARSSKH